MASENKVFAESRWGPNSSTKMPFNSAVESRSSIVPGGSLVVGWVYRSNKPSVTRPPRDWMFAAQAFLHSTSPDVLLRTNAIPLKMLSSSRDAKEGEVL